MDVLKNCNFLDGVVGQSGGEWASPHTARRHKWCGETWSVMSKEGGGPSGCRGRREYGNSRTPRDRFPVTSYFWSTAILNLRPIIGSYMTKYVHAHEVCVIMNCLIIVM